MLARASNKRAYLCSKVEKCQQKGNGKKNKEKRRTRKKENEGRVIFMANVVSMGPFRTPSLLRLVLVVAVDRVSSYNHRRIVAVGIVFGTLAVEVKVSPGCKRRDAQTCENNSVSKS